jgi:hypothetical protein
MRSYQFSALANLFESNLSFLHLVPSGVVTKSGLSRNSSFPPETLFHRTSNPTLYLICNWSAKTTVTEAFLRFIQGVQVIPRPKIGIYKVEVSR